VAGTVGDDEVHELCGDDFRHGVVETTTDEREGEERHVQETNFARDETVLSENRVCIIEWRLSNLESVCGRDKMVGVVDGVDQDRSNEFIREIYSERERESEKVRVYVGMM